MSLSESLDLFFVFSHAEKFLQNDSPANKNYFEFWNAKNLKKTLSNDVVLVTLS